MKAQARKRQKDKKKKKPQREVIIAVLIQHENGRYQVFWTGLEKRSISDGEEVSREKGRAALDTESPDMLRASPV